MYLHCYEGIRNTIVYSNTINIIIYKSKYDNFIIIIDLVLTIGFITVRVLVCNLINIPYPRYTCVTYKCRLLVTSKYEPTLFSNINNIVIYHDHDTLQK